MDEKRKNCISCEFIIHSKSKSEVKCGVGYWKGIDCIDALYQEEDCKDYKRK